MKLRRYLSTDPLTFGIYSLNLKLWEVGKMPNVTFQIPSEVKEILSKHPEIKWDKVVTDTLWNYAKKLRLLDKIASKSKLTYQNAEKLDKAIKAELLKYYKSM
jgi:histidyl-tRNA synthetase